MSITVIIPTYNSEEHIQKCLLSLKRSRITDMNIIVIDNNSKDQTVDRILKLKDIKLIKNKKNLGFARAVNMGIKKAKRKTDILLLNPDTILSGDSLIKLQKCFKTNKAGIVGGKIYGQKKILQRNFVRKPSLLTVIFDYTNLRKLVPGDYFHKHHYYLDKEYPREDLVVDVVSGAYMLISRKVIDTIGLFDENFFMYLEDIDFCIRSRKAGFNTYFCPHSVIFHEGGASSKNADKINHKAWSGSRKYFIKKYFSHYSIPLLYLLRADDFLTTVWMKIKKRF